MTGFRSADSTGEILAGRLLGEFHLDDHEVDPDITVDEPMTDEVRGVLFGAREECRRTTEPCRPPTEIGAKPITIVEHHGEKNIYDRVDCGPRSASTDKMLRVIGVPRV